MIDPVVDLKKKYDGGLLSVAEYNSGLKVHEGLPLGEANLFGNFCHFDISNDEKLDIHEFKLMLLQLGEHAEPQDISVIFQRIDVDKDGAINFNEFKNFLFGLTNVKKEKRFQ